MFDDPAGQYAFQLPSGWAYDTNQSDLSTVHFYWWERPDETITVRATPAFVPPDASAEHWYAALGKRCFKPEMQPFTRLETRTMPAAVAEMHMTDGHPIHWRKLVMRGTRLDIVADHRMAEPSTGPRLSPVLASVLRTIQVPTNEYLPPGVSDRYAPRTDLEAAESALRRRAWDEALQAAARALGAAQGRYLYSVVGNHPFPDIPAVMTIVKALSLMSSASGSCLPARRAEHLALRAECTLTQLRTLARDQREQAGAHIETALKHLVNLQTSMLDLENGDGGLSPGVALAGLRFDYFLKQAHELAQRKEYSDARLYAEAAVEDLMIAVGAMAAPPARAPTLPANVARQFEARDLHSPEEKRTAVWRVLRQSYLGALQSAMRLMLHPEFSTGDSAAVADVSAFLVSVTDAIRAGHAAGVNVEPRDLLSEAGSLIEHASHVSELEDIPALEQAQKALDRAEKLLDEVGEEGRLRAHLCLVRAFVLHAQRRVDGAIEVIDRGLKAAANEPEATAQHIAELTSIKSQFLLNLHRPDEAIEVARKVLDLPDVATPRARMQRASHYLNLAIIERALGLDEDAGRHLLEAVRRILDAPFTESAARILMVSSEHFGQTAPYLSYQLNVAGTAVLDGRRAQLPSDELRIAFDEASRRRELYARLVERLLAANMGSEAVAAADRSRARSLQELIGRAADHTGAQPSSEPLPAPKLVEDDTRRAFEQAASYVLARADAIAAEHGVPAPIRAEEIIPFVQETRAHILILQPVRNRIALILVSPTGRIEAAVSRVPIPIALTCLDDVHQELGIRNAPRGEAAAAAGANAQILRENLEVLWDAVIAPVEAHIPDGASLVIVPYREFALVPFSLLRDRQNRLLMDRWPHVIVPSLATLRTLRRRGTWNRRRPARAYLAGDPALADNFKAAGLAPLQGARAEVYSLQSQLKSSGVPEEAVLLRVDADAHEQSYRTEARGSDLVHLSCHAKARVPAYQSCLYLAPHGPYDGMMLAAEVRDVELNDALVFLAACETGQGRTTADGVIGLGRAFLEAGARAVVLSLWKVDDRSTAVLSSHFYRLLMDPVHPATAAEALRRATLALRRDLEAGEVRNASGEVIDAHEANWAAFTILGDGFGAAYNGGRNGG